MVDYAKLVGEEKARQDSALSVAEIQKGREIDLVALFRDVEIALKEEVARARSGLSLERKESNSRWARLIHVAE